jgi:8-oxo-dGTP pyrophosphatase MutT (NUDIX family)
MRSAGIIVYNIEIREILIGTNRAQEKPFGVGYGVDDKNKTIEQFFNNMVTKYGISYELKDVLPPNIKSDTNLTKLFPDVRFNIVKQLFPEDRINLLGFPERHLVDNDFSCSLSTAGEFSGFPKGGEKEIDSGLLINTALREFYEETGYDFRDILPNPIVPRSFSGPDITNINTVYDIGYHDNYQFYFIPVNNETAQDILRDYSDVKYHSELFNLRFVPIPKLDRASQNVLNFLTKPPLPEPPKFTDPYTSGRSSPSQPVQSKFTSLPSTGRYSPPHLRKENPPHLSGGIPDYHQKYLKYKNKLDC